MAGCAGGPLDKKGNCQCSGHRLIQAREQASKACWAIEIGEVFFMTAPVDGLLYEQVRPGDAKDWEAPGSPATVGEVYRPKWPLSQFERARLALKHEPEASASPDGFRLATCVVCERPMVAMWHLWLDDGGLKKEIHMCHVCATDVYGAPTPSIKPEDPGWELIA